MMTDRITATHLQRAAIVYVRQSSPEQVRNHAESTRIQIGLRDKARSEEHTSELQSPYDLVCRLLLEKKNHSCIFIPTQLRFNNSRFRLFTFCPLMCSPFSL